MNVSTKPASGMRDFLPDECRRRDHVFGVIEDVYRSYGFEKLDTPCLERLTTLLGKYGEEGDKLIFKVLMRGQKLTRALGEHESPAEADLADMGLRYDLTVPLARVYAEYRNAFPRIFKRFQIAPVWRADRPQKGRYREFYQCDVDVVGSSSMMVEAEVTSALCEILERLEFDGFRLHVNHRKLLFALMEASGIEQELESEALVAIDKLDKIGRDGVVAELAERGIAPESIERLMEILAAGREGDNGARLERLSEYVGEVEQGRAAIADLRKLVRFADAAPSGPYLNVDPYLARGLSYYTGPIFEIRSDDFSGSLGGGGRYDGLIGMFSKQDVPACGFSLGVERIFVLMEEREMLTQSRADVDVLVTMWDEDFVTNSLTLARELRDAGLRTDVYTDQDRYGKQFKYADARNIPFVAILAPDELEAGVVAIKNMKTGDQESVERDRVADYLKREGNSDG